MNSKKEMTRQIMVDAWSLYRQTVAEDPSAANKATFAACLRYAWERHPARYAARIRREWAVQGAAQQLNSCRRMAQKAAATHESKCGAFVDWSRVELDDIAADTWIILQERLDTLEAIQATRNREGRLPLPLGVLLHRAAAEALRRYIRDAVKNGCDELDESTAAENTRAEMESSAVIRAALSSIKNPTQRAVLALLLQGQTVREIAAALGKSKSTTQRMIDSIRAQLAVQLAA